MEPSTALSRREPTMPIQSLIEADRQHLIHPVINYRAHEARGVTVLESASGAFLRDAAGNELLDAFSGLWCVNVGYGQQSIVEAATAQMTTAATRRATSISAEPRYRTGGKTSRRSRPLRCSTCTSRSAARTRSIRQSASSRTYFNATRPSVEEAHHRACNAAITARRPGGAGLTALPAFHRNSRSAAAEPASPAVALCVPAILSPTTPR